MSDDPVYQRLRIPIRPHVDAELFVPFPMTEDDWRQFQGVLAAMKPGLVTEPVIIEEDGPLRLSEGELRDLRERYPADDEADTALLSKRSTEET